MNASQRLWRRLATMIPAEQYDWLIKEYRQDLANDRKYAEFRKNLRRCAEAGYTLNTYHPDPETTQRARVKLDKALKWLNEHEDWNPEAGGRDERPAGDDSQGS